jgi:hypothetical protein
MVEVIGVLDMRIERCGVVLGKHVHALYSGVDTIGDRYINESVLAANRHGGL